MVAPNKLSLTSKDFLVIWSPIYYKKAFLNEKIGQKKKRKWIFLFCVFRVEQWSNFVSFSACWFWRWYVSSLCIIAWRILSFPVCWLLKEAAVHLMRWTFTSCLKGFFSLSQMEESSKMPDNHLTSAAAFVEGGIQDACDDACSICLESFCDSDPSTVCKMFM